MSFDLPPQPAAPLFVEEAQVVAAAKDFVPVERVKSVFLTYAHADTRFVEETYDSLSKLGIEVFLDKYKLTVGEIDGQIISNLKRADYQVVFCTRAANESRYVRKEVAFFESIGGKQIPIVIDPIGRMEWFHFHLIKQNAIMLDQIADCAAAQLAIDRQLKRLLGLEFGPAL